MSNYITISHMMKVLIFEKSFAVFESSNYFIAKSVYTSILLY